MTKHTGTRQTSIELTKRVIDLLYERLSYAYTDAMRKDIRHEIRGIYLLRERIRAGEPYNFEIEEMVAKYEEEL